MQQLRGVGGGIRERERAPLEAIRIEARAAGGLTPASAQGEGGCHGPRES